MNRTASGNLVHFSERITNYRIREVRFDSRLSILSGEMSSSSDNAGLRISLSFFTPSSFVVLSARVPNYYLYADALSPSGQMNRVARDIIFSNEKRKLA